MSNNLLSFINDSLCELKDLTVLDLSNNFINCSSESLPQCVNSSCFNQNTCYEFDMASCKGRYFPVCSWHDVFEICADDLLEQRLGASLFCEVTQGYCKKDNCLNPCNEMCGASCTGGVITSFDGSGKGLAYLPENFGTDEHFRSIETLNLDDNHLSLIPASVEFMSNLSRVHLSGNEFRIFPNIIFVYQNDESSLSFDTPTPEVHHSSMILRNIESAEDENDAELSSSGSGSSFTPFKLTELYLNENNLTEIPSNINALKYLLVL